MPMFGEDWPARRERGIRRSGWMPASFEGWMERMMQDPSAFFAESGMMPGPWPWMRARSLPPVDVQEDEKSYVVKVDLPGFNKDNIEITVHSDQGIEIRGRQDEVVEQRDDTRGYLRQERRTGSVHRFIPFPGPVVEEQVAAAYDNGVLTVTLPKATGSGPASGRRISIR